MSTEAEEPAVSPAGNGQEATTNKDADDAESSGDDVPIVMAPPKPDSSSESDDGPDPFIDEEAHEDDRLQSSMIDYYRPPTKGFMDYYEEDDLLGGGGSREHTPFYMNASADKKEKKEDTNPLSTKETQRRLVRVKEDKYHRRVVHITDEIKMIRTIDKVYEGDRKAYEESSMRQRDFNAEKIRRLRAANKILRRELVMRVRGDEVLVKRAFDNADNPMPPRFAGMDSKKARQELDRKISLSKKRLDLLCYKNKQHETRVEELRTDFNARQLEYKYVTKVQDNEIKEAKTLTTISNEVMLIRERLKDARRINTLYHVMVEKMANDRIHFDRLLLAILFFIKRRQREYLDASFIFCSVHETADDVKRGVTDKEGTLHDIKKKNNNILGKYQKIVEEYREEAENPKRRSSMMYGPEAVPKEPEKKYSVQQKAPVEGEMEGFREVMLKIGAAIGTKSPITVARLLENEAGLNEALKEEADKSKKSVGNMKERREEVEEAFKKLKFSQAAKLSSGQRMLDDMRKQIESVKKEDKLLEIAALEVWSKVDEVRNGILHLSQKLAHLPDPVKYQKRFEVPKTDEEHIMEVAHSCQAKLIDLGKTLEEQARTVNRGEMNALQFMSSMVERMPQTNMRVSMEKKLSQTKVKIQREKDMRALEEDIVVKPEYISRERIRRQVNRFQGVGKKKKKNRKKRTGYGV